MGAGSSGASNWPWEAWREKQGSSCWSRVGGLRPSHILPGTALERMATSLDIKVGTHSPPRAKGPEPTFALPLEEANGQSFPLAQEMHITAIPKGLPYEL